MASIFLISSILACGGVDPPQVQPKIEATVLAKVEEILAARLDAPVSTPTPTPEPTPTPTPTPVPVEPTSTPKPTPAPTPTPTWPEIVSIAVVSVVAIKTPAGTGTGFFIDDGLILTNAHVVGQFHKATIAVHNDEIKLSVTGDVVGVDEDTDLALVSVGSDFDRPALIFGDIESTELAEEVIVIGFPLSNVLGDAVNVTRGIIASMRTIDGLEYLQTDAAANPGNSGGPLLNSKGEVVGIITLRARLAAGGFSTEGTSLAISVAAIKERLPSLRE